MDYLPIQSVDIEQEEKEKAPSKTSMQYLFFSKVANTKNFSCDSINEQFHLPIQ